MTKLILSTLSILIFTSCSSSVTLTVPYQFKTIQSAVDAASYGDTVLVSPGTYFERIKLKPGILVISEGGESKGKQGLARAEKTIIDGSRSKEGEPGVEMAVNSTLNGFTVTGVGKYDETKWNKHFATRGEQQSHDHIGEPGIAGISAQTDCTILNNIVHHIGYSGIALSGENCTATVKLNLCFRNMGGGIGSMNKSRALIEQNTCYENFYAGIGHDGASPKVIKNICFGNIRAGIGISEGASPFVYGNRCYKNRRAGIGIRTGSNTKPVVEDNDCYENGMAGIGTKDDAKPIIRDNRCYKNTLAGIGSRNNSQPQIIGNECYENGQAGIGCMGSKEITISKNHCHHNRTAGIGFSPTKNGYAGVTENRLIDNNTVAIGIQSGWTVVIKKNEISRKAGMPPLVMVFKDAIAIFTDNSLNGGGVAAVRVGGRLIFDDNKVIGNGPKQGGPPNFGIWALPGSKILMRINEFSGWRHALHATGAEITARGNKIENFSGTALVILKPSKPVTAVGNKAYSSNPKAKVLKVDEPHDSVTLNRIIRLKK